MNYTFDFNAVSIAPLLQGLWVSLQLTAAANAIGIVLGFGLALLIMSPIKIVRLPFMLFRRILPLHAGDRPNRLDFLLRADAVRCLPRSDDDGHHGRLGSI